MIYGYTYRAPWIGLANTVLYCKNIDRNSHSQIHHYLQRHGFYDYVIKDDVYYSKMYLNNPESKFLLFQYSGPTHVIESIINELGILIINRFDEKMEKQEENGKTGRI